MQESTESFEEFLNFYHDREKHYKEISKELSAAESDYSKHYTGGGYGYSPSESRSWILQHTSLPNIGGTCLDVGSGDGFWSWILSEWCDVTGIEPDEGSVEFSNAIKKRLHPRMQNRTKFIAGDALEVDQKYDAVFCRAPSFLNYPLNKPYSPSLLDADREKLKWAWLNLNGYSPEQTNEKLANYPKSSIDIRGELSEYTNKGLEYFEKMISIANKYFIFILSSHPKFYGEYLGDTYNHDPKDIEAALAKYGTTNVRLVGGYVVAEVFLE